MVKDIIRDEAFLSQKSEEFNFEKDQGVITDLLDTAESFGLKCAGLAAVQIGKPVKAIVVRVNETLLMPMVNPAIFMKKEPYTSTEGCLSLDGERQVKRFRVIKVAYKSHTGKAFIKEFKGYMAKVIQHEVDHLHGILI